jgi:hypothetical protein
MSGISKSVQTGDALLRRAVLTRLVDTPAVSTGHICVVAKAGRVTLSGYVTSRAQKDAATAATLRVKGVDHLTDQLLVAAPAAGLGDPATEEAPAHLPTAAPRQIRPVYLTQWKEPGATGADVRPR